MGMVHFALATSVLTVFLGGVNLSPPRCETFKRNEERCLAGLTVECLPVLKVNRYDDLTPAMIEKSRTQVFWVYGLRLKPLKVNPHGDGRCQRFAVSTPTRRKWAWRVSSLALQVPFHGQAKALEHARCENDLTKL